MTYTSSLFCRAYMSVKELKELLHLSSTDTLNVFFANNSAREELAGAATWPWAKEALNHQGKLLLYPFLLSLPESNTKVIELHNPFKMICMLKHAKLDYINVHWIVVSKSYTKVKSRRGAGRHCPCLQNLVKILSLPLSFSLSLPLVHSLPSSLSPSLSSSLALRSLFSVLAVTRLMSLNPGYKRKHL